MGRSQRWRLAPLFFAAGGLALAVQFTLLRELMASLQGDETAVGMGLAAWLAGIGAGASLARALVPGRPEKWAATGFALLALAGPAEIVAARAGRWVLAPPPGELLSLAPALALAAAVLFPAGTLVGITFTALACTAPGAGWRVGEGLAGLYVAEAIGSLAGGLLVTFIVAPYLQPLQGIFLSGGIWILAGSIAARSGLLPGRRFFPLLGLALLALSLPFLTGPLERRSAELRFRGIAPGIPLRASADTPYQQMTIGGGSTLHLFTGGQYAGSFPDPSEDESLSHQLLSLSPHPGSIFMAGGGTTGTLRFLLAGPVRRVDLVEIDRRALLMISDFLPSSDRAALLDPRVRIVTDDPRRFLARQSARYDLMLVLEPPPVTLFLARLSTAEFYRLCREHLAADGALVVRSETAPSVLTGETAAMAGSLWGALRAIFPVVRAGPGPESLFVAGTDGRAVTLDPAVLARRYGERNASSKVFVPELFPILFPPERVAGQEAALDKAAASVAPSRDDRPVSFLHALARRQTLAGGLLAPVIARASRASPAALGSLALLPSLLVLGVLMLRRDPARAASLAATHAVAVTGACGMGWSLLILYSFQARAGALYGAIGFLTALFMLGLAAGGLALAGSAELSAERARRRLPAAIAAALLFALAMPGILRALGNPALGRPGFQETAHALLLFTAGAVTGSLFPVAAGVLLSELRGIVRTSGGLEAADHWGAAGAALLGGIVYIPAMGLSAGARIPALLEAAALLGALLPWLRRR